MPRHSTPEPAAPWVELTVGPEDWDAADPDLLRTIHAQLVWCARSRSTSSSSPAQA